jgi:hypothetical protein
VDPRHVLVLWDIRQGLRSLTLQEAGDVRVCYGKTVEKLWKTRKDGEQH